MIKHWIGAAVALCVTILFAGLASPAAAQVTEAQVIQQCKDNTPLPDATWTYKTGFVGWTDVQWGVQNPHPGKNVGDISVELMVSASALFECTPDKGGANPGNLAKFIIPVTPRGTSYLGDQPACANEGGQSKMVLGFPGAACPWAYNGGFPAVANYNSAGPYSVKAYNIVNGPACTIYGPDPATFNLRAPIVVFGIESGNTIDEYGGVFARMASHGFVVVAANAASPNPSALQSCLDGLLVVSDSPGDPFYRKLNTNLIATSGHGVAVGAAVFVAAQDKRVSTMVGFQPSLVASLPNGYTSATAVITEVAEGRFEGQGIFDGAPSPSVYAEDQTNTNTLNDRKLMVGLAFLRWRLMQDATAGNMFNQTCTLCTDAGWRVQRK